MTIRLTAAFILLASLFALGACANTVRGVGADVGNTVDAGEAAANDIVY
ncbi:hypothetical protein FP2506_02959 [Fulvimarina pelagi HTCC2506]|uniref:Entericidin EcnAB n=1 Tax=Fulvimarina pelagi HTCC2506 TaxID=314231 RepID=Q0G0E1_9HYPH|nr:hypothetical protein [Fulvimarina pelagi]EAU40652.1 hypothetical protein FP2506_02959 [Fulvimarina pelagi HTCC2506]